MSDTRIVIFAKAPQSGQAKTRLIPALGAAGTAKLAERMLIRTLDEALAAGIGPVELCLDPPHGSSAWHGFQLPLGVEISAQGEGDLGVRMARAARRGLDLHQPVLLTGTDCPQLDAQTLRDAALLLETHHAVMHPARDGGYVLLGLSVFHTSLFDAVPWSTPQVAAVTRQRLDDLGWHAAIGRTLADIDEPADLIHLPADWRLALDMELAQ